MNLHKALRYLVPEEVKALLEKIDSLDRHDSSSYPIERLVKNGKFTSLERKLLRNALNRVQRRQTLSDAMHVVIYGDVERSKDDLEGRISSDLDLALNRLSGTFTMPAKPKTVLERKRAISYGYTGL